MTAEKTWKLLWTLLPGLRWNYLDEKLFFSFFLWKVFKSREVFQACEFSRTRKRYDNIWYTFGRDYLETLAPMVWLLASFLFLDLLQIWVHPLLLCPRWVRKKFWPLLKCMGAICSAISRLKTGTEAMNCHEDDVLGKPYTLVQRKDKLTRLCTCLFVVLSSGIWLDLYVAIPPFHIYISNLFAW